MDADIKTPVLQDGREMESCKGNAKHSCGIIPQPKGENNMSEAIVREEEYESPEGFVVDSDAKALWVLEKIRKARADRDELVEWYKIQTKKIEEQTDFNTMYLEKLLADYFRTVPHKKTKTQESYSLPGGKLVMKKQQPEFKRDDKAAIDWLKQNGGGQFVKVEERLDWDGLKKSSGIADGKVIFSETINEDGEIIQNSIPGIEVIEREDKFVVEVK